MTRIKRSLKAYPFSLTCCLSLSYCIWATIEHAFVAFFITLQVTTMYYWYWFSTSYDFDSKYYQIIITNWRGQKTSIHIAEIDCFYFKPLLFGSGHLNINYQNKPYQIKNIANAQLWKKRFDERKYQYDELMDQIKLNQNNWNGVLEDFEIPINLTAL